MKLNNHLLQELEKLNYLDVQAYLEFRHWEVRESKRENVQIFFKKDNNNVFEVQLPLTRDFDDYSQIMFNIMAQIAQSEQRDISSVINDFLYTTADIIRLKISTPDTITGTITLEEGLKLLENSKKTLVSTIHDMIQPTVYHKRLGGLEKIDEFMKQCRLGQTEKGSFIVSLICPVKKLSQTSLFPEMIAPSFNRQVTRKLMLSLDSIKKAIDNNDIIAIEKPPSDKEAMVSANFLESLVEMNSNKENINIQVLATWSDIEYIEDTIPRRVEIKHTDISILEKMIVNMIPKDEDKPGDFIGKISSTKANPNLFQRTEGEITFNFMYDSDNIIKAKVILDFENYTKACEAHADGKDVQITGVLRTIGKTKTIENPSFKVL